MPPILSILGSTVIFIALYFEVFLLISLFETKKKRKEAKTLEYFYPPVTILIPVWNEENTVEGTLSSLMDLDYPKDKMKIMVIDDGSTDNTREVLRKYENHPVIQVVYKENGGKFTALNFGISQMTTDFVGCLDADSFVQKDALKNIMRRFSDPTVMAVTPSMIVERPTNILRRMQRAEYNYGNFIRKAYGSIGAIHITPGPFSFFRKEVFEKLGGYRHAHNTEDMEMAMRMQKNGMKIVNAPDAIVFTVGPDTIKKLYKQRVRWVSGFLSNLLDYKDMIFNKKYGDLGLLVLPFALVSLLLSFVMIAISLYQIGGKVLEFIGRTLIIGFQPVNFTFDWFFIDTSALSILTATLIIFILGLVIYGYKTVYGRWVLSLEIFYFLFLYSFIAPFWLAKSIYNSAFRKKVAWR